jgi:hypothetical protein
VSRAAPTILAQNMRGSRGNMGDTGIVIATANHATNVQSASQGRLLKGLGTTISTTKKCSGKCNTCDLKTPTE